MKTQGRDGTATGARLWADEEGGIKGTSGEGGLIGLHGQFIPFIGRQGGGADSLAI